jgi:hypothetical protein
MKEELKMLPLMAESLSLAYYLLKEVVWRRHDAELSHVHEYVYVNAFSPFKD